MNSIKTIASALILTALAGQALATDLNTVISGCGSGGKETPCAIYPPSPVPHVLLVKYKTGFGAALLSQEFSSKENCEFAKQAFDKINTGYTTEVEVAICVKK